MAQNLSEQLHAKMDALGARPRNAATVTPLEPAQPPVEDGFEEPTIAAGETDEALLATPDDEPLPGEEPLEGEESDATATAEEGGAEGTPAPDEGLDRYKAAELAEAIGWDAKTLYTSLEIPFGNGETLTLGEMKDGWSGVLEKQAEVETARAAIETERQQLEQHRQQLLQGAQGISEGIQEAQGQMRAIEAQYEHVDWAKLDAENPGQAANTRQKFATAYSQAEAQLQKAQAEATQAQKQALEEVKVRESQRMVELVPEWKDPKVCQAEGPKIHEFLLNNGFTAQDLSSIYHAGAWKIARMAWKAEQNLHEVEQAKTKVRNAPRPVMRPRGGPPRQQIESKRIDALTQRAQQTGQPGDKLSAARAIMQQALSKRKTR